MIRETYILGAGFSRFATLPLMDDFYYTSKDIFPELDDESKKVFNNVFNYFDHFSRSKNYMNTDLLNIEELLSIIEMDKYLNNRTRIKKDYLTYLKKVIEIITSKYERDIFGESKEINDIEFPQKRL